MLKQTEAYNKNRLVLDADASPIALDSGFSHIMVKSKSFFGGPQSMQKFSD